MARQNSEAASVERERDRLQDAVDTALDNFRNGDLKAAVRELEGVETEEGDDDSD